MADENLEDLPPGAVRALQTIAFALLMGVVTYAGVAVYLTQTQALPARPDPMLSYMSLGFFVLMVVMWFIVPSQLMKAQITQIAMGTWKSPVPARTFVTDTGKLCAVYQTGNIIGWALLEGSAFFSITAFLLEQKTLPLYVVGGAVLLMLQTFPTRGLIENWINRQKEVIAEIRSTRPPQ